MKPGTKILVDKVRLVLSEEPVARAWLFGSYARGQENEDSDLDLLVEMAPNNLTMIGFLKIQLKFFWRATLMQDIPEIKKNLTKIIDQ